jgi:23S rRNA (cytidine1920-2'-O)/16S rRNA (cytidine1409-2'-O)-methyltransferase
MVQRGLAASREQAQRLIRAGQVRVEDRVVDKPGPRHPVEARIEVRQPPRYVSRGGEKLQGAFDAFDLDVTGRICIDVGASTGGFTDCLLQHGAARVIAVDVGKGQLHWKLRNDPRVTVMEGCNARYLRPSDLSLTPDFATADLSFISLTRVLPALCAVLAAEADLVLLIKPQFEAGRAQVGKGGVVRDPAVRQAVVDKVREFGEKEMGLTWMGGCPSPLKGPAGNVEYLACFGKRGPA